VVPTLTDWLQWVADGIAEALLVRNGEVTRGGGACGATKVLLDHTMAARAMAKHTFNWRILRAIWTTFSRNHRLQEKGQHHSRANDGS